MFENKVATTTLNILHLINWPHLCGNDPWAKIFQFTATHKASKKFLMGQASKRSLTWSTNERIGWKRTRLCKGKAPMKNEACNLREKKEERKKKNTFYLDKLSKYKNTSSSDTTEESFP